MKKETLILMLLLVGLVANAQTYKTVKDIAYTTKNDAYAQERLKLDVYYPEGAKDCPVIVWFHGGGIDRHAAEYGGDPKKIVVTGHSAGGYLAMLLCLNKAWLKAYDVDADEVWMYAPFSGQAVTHYNVRKMRGIGPLQVVIDEYAPIYWVRPDCPTFVLICGDREQELLGRYDENQYLARMMKLAGHKKTYLYELDGHDHVSMVEPSFHILETHIKQLLEEKK